MIVAVFLIFNCKNIKIFKKGHKKLEFGSKKFNC